MQAKVAPVQRRGGTGKRSAGAAASGKAKRAKVGACCRCKHGLCAAWRAEQGRKAARFRPACAELPSLLCAFLQASHGGISGSKVRFATGALPGSAAASVADMSGLLGAEMEAVSDTDMPDDFQVSGESAPFQLCLQGFAAGWQVGGIAPALHAQLS